MSAQKKKEQVDPGSLALLTRQVRNFLAFHQDMGLAAYPALPELRQFLTHVQKQVQQQQGRAGGQHSNAVPKNNPQVARPGFDQGYKQSRASGSQQAPASQGVESVQQQLTMLNQELVQC
ncbi:MAG: hypothetical protein D3916_13235, partial [Candidatus Electrothrix sp. MAN1_4]|nr:hypothetical protein [Candidatus Electrothrix sp. MAN1_4]